MPIRLSGMVSGLDTEAIVEELMTAQRAKQTKVENKQTKLTWKQEKWKELNTKLYSFYTNKVSKLRLEGSYMTKKVTSSDESIVSATVGSSASKGAHSLTVNSLASAQYVTSAKIQHKDGTTKLNGQANLVSSLGMTAGTKLAIKAGDKDAVEFEVTDSSTLSDFVKACQEAGINANFDEKQQRLFLSSKESGSENSFTLTELDADGNVSSTDDQLKLLGIGNITSDMASGNTAADISGGDTGFSMKVAKDAEIILDGATLKSSTNNMIVNGLTLDLVSADPNKEIRLSVEDDIDAVYDMVKDFVKEYNSILKEINELYYADSAKGYEPLTDEQKEAMSEDEVKKWEDKIKSALFRRDTTLGNIASGMRTSMMGQVKVDGKSYSLASFGIMTSTDYSEKGLLHIYGDSEDDTYADQEDKLKKALSENPDAVVQTLSTIGQNLYKDMTDRMGKTALSSALTFYNDLEITKQLNSYKKEISNWEDKLADMEDRYYKQFTAMEKAMASLNNTSSSLAGMLGMSQ